jgi:hypothetical protein
MSDYLINQRRVSHSRTAETSVMPSPGKRTLTMELPPVPAQRRPEPNTGAGAEVPVAPRGVGQPLPAGVRAKMETSFGADFSAVRVHEGDRAPAIGALAYAKGTDIHFAPERYQPETRDGQELLGHELAHVVQQSQGRVRATTLSKGGAVNDDPSLEREADEMGARAARGQPASAQGAGTSTARLDGTAGPSREAAVQRKPTNQGTSDDDPEPQDGVALNPLRKLHLWDGITEDRMERLGRVNLLRQKLNAQALGVPLDPMGGFDNLVLARIHLFEDREKQPHSDETIRDETADLLWGTAPPALDTQPDPTNEMRGLIPGDGLREGRTDADIKRRVRLLQQFLNKRLPATLPEDGNFWVGNGTLQAWNDWQQRVGEPPSLAPVTNYAVDLLERGNVKDPKKKPDPPTPEPPQPVPKLHGHNGIVGLRHGDGATPETRDLQRFVRKLQQLLNEHSDDHDSVLEVNGKFDDDTLAMLHEFQRDNKITPADPEEVDQATADALHNGHEKQTWNSELEDRLDALWLAHQMNMQHQLNALETIKADLTPNADPFNPGKLLLKTLLRTPFSVLFASVIPDLLTSAFNSLVKDSDAITWGDRVIDAIFDAVKDTTGDVIQQKVDDASDARLTGFIQSQRETLIVNAQKEQTSFLTKGKAEARIYKSSPADGPKDKNRDRDKNKDPRVARVDSMIEAEIAKRGDIFEAQYRTSLGAWSVGLAQSTLHTQGDPEHGPQGTNIGNLGKDLSGGTRGVFQIEAIGNDPQHPVAIQAVKIQGLPDGARAHLVGRAFDDLSIPYAVELLACSPTREGDTVKIKLAINEAHEESVDDKPGKQVVRRFTWGPMDEPDVRLWLARKVMPTAQPSDDLGPLAFQGAQKVLVGEIGRLSVDKIDG